MKLENKIPADVIHISKLYLPDFYDDVDDLFLLLSDDEKERALRFKFENHRKRFTITRAMLRKTLSYYLGINATELEFSISIHGKPYLSSNPLKFEFNVSHSNDCAIIGVCQFKPIGVDIENVKQDYNDGVAKRMFNAIEYSTLNSLHKDKKVKNFYRIWSKKEAIVKLFGGSIFEDLKEYSIADKFSQNITIKNNEITIEEIFIDKEYQAAVAVNSPLASIEYWGWINSLYQKISLERG